MYPRLYTLDYPLFTYVVCIELEVSEEFHLSSLDVFLYIIYFQHRKWGEGRKGDGRQTGMHEEREQEMEGERNKG